MQEITSPPETHQNEVVTTETDQQVWNYYVACLKPSTNDGLKTRQTASFKPAKGLD